MAVVLSWLLLGEHITWSTVFELPPVARTPDRHVAAQRNLFNRLLGCLHHCLHTGQTYNEATAFPTPSNTTQARAA